MNNLLNMLTKAGYEVSSIGSDVLPCTLRLGNDPIGFLMEDLTVRLLPNRENEQDRILPVIKFASENQGIEQVNGEFKLSQYQDVVLAASFDYNSCKPIYNIYYEDKEKNWILRDSFEEKAAATQNFASRSSLIPSNIPTPTREVDRIRQFMDAVKAKGYKFLENYEEAHRAFDIADSNGHIVGYIGKDNRVSITSENNRVKRTLTSAYLDTNPDRILLPRFFERLKERLKEIGLALKVIFTPKGRHYAIHNEHHQEIATVSEQHQVAYTDMATDAQRAKIDALVEELRREGQEKTQPKKEKIQETERTESVPVISEPIVSADEVRHLAEAVLTDQAIAEIFFQAVLSNPDFVVRLNERMAESQQGPAKETPAAEKPENSVQAEKQELKENPAAAKVQEDFNRDYMNLQTLFGFNQEKYDAVKADMSARYGTADPKEFQAFLKQGKFDKADTLQGRLKTSQNIADLKNAKAQPEKTQERERA